MNKAKTLAGVHTHTHTHTCISNEIKKVIALVKNGVLFSSQKNEYIIKENKIAFLSELANCKRI